MEAIILCGEVYLLIRKIDVFYAGGLSRDLVGQIMPVMDKY